MALHLPWSAGLEHASPAVVIDGDAAVEAVADAPDEVGREGHDRDAVAPEADEGVHAAGRQRSSTTTLVDFTTALALSPGLRSSSSAASRDIKETIR